jgi:hypothetical protein
MGARPDLGAFLQQDLYYGVLSGLPEVLRVTLGQLG